MRWLLRIRDVLVNTGLFVELCFFVFFYFNIVLFCRVGEAWEEDFRALRIQTGCFDRFRADYYTFKVACVGFGTSSGKTINCKKALTASNQSSCFHKSFGLGLQVYRKQTLQALFHQHFLGKIYSGNICGQLPHRTSNSV